MALNCQKSTYFKDDQKRSQDMSLNSLCTNVIKLSKGTVLNGQQEIQCSAGLLGLSVSKTT